MSLAARCAPRVAVKTLQDVAQTESGLNPWALHDNTTGRSEQPVSFDAALADASVWAERGDSVDIGLMQINSANLTALGMTARTALDPCASLAGGAAVLQAAYGGGNTPAGQQAALLMALSRYNTGSPIKGILNGYTRKVMANGGGRSVPPPMATPASSSPAALSPDPNAPPSWNVEAVGLYAQTHGAPWLISLSPAASRAKPPGAPSAPTTAPAT